MKVKDILDEINDFAPFELAEEWDNVGLLLGKQNSEVNRILLCVDVTSSVIEEAIQNDCQLIIAHHPIIFESLQKINDETVKGKQIIDLLANGIAVIAAHTNADCAHDGMNDYLANLLGLENVHQSGERYLRVGNLQCNANLNELVELIKNKLEIDNVIVAGCKTDNIKRCGVLTGSAEIKELLAAKDEFDVVVTGEFSYHKGMELLEEGISSILCSHFSSEHLFKKWIDERLKRKFPDIITCFSESESNPFRIM